MAMEKKFDAATAEAKIYAKWEDAKAFAAGANARDGKDSFSVMIPPPNVTGNLHIGHAFNNTLQDILIRWKRMQGFDTLWQPGTDHAGIATQMVVERKLAETQQPSRAEMGREAFLEKVWEWKAESGGTIINQLKRLGASCDWDREAFTMSGNFPDAVIKVFVEMYNKGLIYRGKRLVNWDPHFETAISDLEVENIEVAGHMWHFKYPLAGGATYTYEEKDEDGNVTLSEERDYISIATTRPETMLGDGAVAVHPTDERYAPIVGMLCEIPVGPKAQRRLIPIITDEYPDKDFGSGAVKITGAHDFNDYQVAKRGGIPMYSLMDTKGNMRSYGPPYVDEATTAQAIAIGKAEFTEASIAAMNMVPEEYRGLDRFDARKAVIADITAEGLAVMVDQTSTDDDGNETTTSIPYVENKPVMQPFGDRSKVVIEPMLTDQWFVDTAKIVGPALDAVKDGTVKIIPESGEKVYYHWLENIEPWCISRQLWWGHQIPVWYGPLFPEGGISETNGPSSNGFVRFCAPNFEEVQAQAKKYYGTDSIIENVEGCGPEFKIRHTNSNRTIRVGWDTIELPSGKFKASEIGLCRDPDVLDTWFSSGLWPIGTLGWPEQTDALDKYFPTSTLITGQDILFFWVARMMMMQIAVVDEIPFDTVYLHGLVRDAKGKKMSKSTGNVIDPLDIIDEFGADALRFTNASMASIGGALKLDTQRIAGYRNFGTKLWNAASYGDFKGSFALPHTDNAPETKLPLNKWIKGEIAKTLATVDDALAAFRFNDAANALYAFVWGTFCSQYLEYTKPVLDGEDAAAAAETLATYAWALDQCLILMHPIMPFITEEIWGQKQRPKMLIHTDWPTYTTAEMVDTKADAELTWVTKMIETIRSVRTQMRVPASAFIPLAVQGISPEARSAWDQNASLITRLARIETLTEVEIFESGAVTLGVSGGTFALPLADVIDVAEEKARLENTMKKLEKEIGGMKGRLNNPNFVASAPDEVVDETRANLASKEEEAAKLKIALGQLA
ncbi:valyl-tRNA synthetase [Rhodobacteraceae bacterium HTCC2150]|nr:valyl-tRNA synthetase [Rhodobacteraceae bacterium HTCC2150]